MHLTTTTTTTMAYKCIADWEVDASDLVVSLNTLQLIETELLNDDKLLGWLKKTNDWMHEKLEAVNGDDKVKMLDVLRNLLDRDITTIYECTDETWAPNIFPYKMCCHCSERCSCGSYDDDNNWICEDCSVVCTKCSRLCCDYTTTITLWNKGFKSEALCENCNDSCGEELAEDGYIKDE